MALRAIGMLLNRGAGENRTPVQTSNYNAFYVLSFRLVFDARLTGNGLTYT